MLDPKPKDKDELKAYLVDLWEREGQFIVPVLDQIPNL